VNSFASRIVRWQGQHGRHDLPWQTPRDPYRIWLSEIMLQQTQVATVIPYFNRFVARFPDIGALAAASQDDVLALWSGLGYYSRARNLHTAAGRVVALHRGRFPTDDADIAALPGVGRSTAAAIAALAFGQPRAILDGNVKRVLARHGGVDGWPGSPKVESALWQLAESRLPTTAIEAYTQGLMDLGATVCTRSKPTCARCPVKTDCVARKEDRVHTLPTPRPRKAVPERQVQMMMLLDRDELLLEKRAARGVWGGLWSLPELPADIDVAHHCRERFGMDAIGVHALTPLTHTFTHFRLHIQPVLARLSSPRIATSHHVWLPLDEALAAALPAPVRKLVERIERI
jgi:A/G-specific adenine glycosylase